MDKQLLANSARKIGNKEDLLDLLNLIKKDEMQELGMADRFRPLTIKHINCYCNPNNTRQRYSQFKIKKKTGGFRLITAPQNENFKQILRCLNILFKSMYTPSNYAMGFAESKSVVTNANVHKHQNYVFNIDLKNFFPSIDQARVWKRLQIPPFKFPIPVANVVAGLCCMKIMEEDGKTKYVLPQGAPTSPIITNMICDKLDHRLAGLAKKFHLKYSRYADDITFSSMINVYQTNGDFRKELKRIIEDQGFSINEKKTRLQKRGARQEVTGIIVGEKLNVTQKYVREIRNILYIWDRYGYNVAYNKFYPKYKIEKGHVKKGIPDLMHVLDGKLLYLKMIKGEEDSVFQRLSSKFNVLVEKSRQLTATSNSGVTYLETTHLPEFERRNNIEVKISPKRPSTQTQKGGTDENHRTSGNGNRYAYYTLDGIKIMVSVNKNISKEEESDKERLAISNCRDTNGKAFMLLHRYVPKGKEINIDELNNELDSLLNIRNG